ncbi:hypothetical protein [Acetobacterium wieringae]|uniref:Lipoprotein n=1 Tax=Acetobacterium wieringae TaxID=52694 RepID=A0A1F2PEN9_9FIRM|nr:hypothetical protein [Acetobacterium wieringae]OFV69131.1 hypothetical protein ACWI_33250 [Acetobacterium wieringae]
MNIDFKKAGIVTIGTFLFTTACISIGGVVSGAGPNMGAAVAIGIIAAMCVAAGIAFSGVK